MMFEDMIPIAEYAKLIGKNPVNVRQKCQRGTLPGAVKIGRDWFIPKGTPYPDQRIKSGKYINFRKTTKG